MHKLFSKEHRKTIALDNWKKIIEYELYLLLIIKVKYVFFIQKYLSFCTQRNENLLSINLWMRLEA